MAIESGEPAIQAPQDAIIDVAPPVGPHDILSMDPEVALTAERVELLQAAAAEAAEDNAAILLRNVFDSMSTNGKITLDQLPFVMMGAEVPATAKEIEDAIDEHIPDADDSDALLDFQQVEFLYQHLMRNIAEILPLEALGDEEKKKVSLLQRFRQWRAARKRQHELNQTAFEKHMKPTTRLLILILCTACSISVAIVLTASLVIWDNSLSTVQGHMLREVKVLKDGISLFGFQKPSETYDSNMQSMAWTVGLLVEELGFQGNKNTMELDLAYQQKLLSSVLDGWFKHDATSRVADSAMMFSHWVTTLTEMESVSAAVQMVDQVNPTLPAGHEIVLATQNSDNTTQYLTAFRFKTSCAGGQCVAFDGAKDALLGLTGTTFTDDYQPTPVILAYTYLPASHIGLLYKMNRATVLNQFEAPVATLVDQVNEMVREGNVEVAAGDSILQELVLARADDSGKTVLVSHPAFSLANVDAQNSPLTAALQGVTGTVETGDRTNGGVFMVYGPMPYSGMATAIQVPQLAYADSLLQGLSDAVNVLNTQMLGTVEVQFATAANGVNTSMADFPLQFRSDFKYADQCPAVGCGNVSGTSEYLRLAIAQCQSGLVHGLDYRAAPVIAGYTCVSSLDAGIAMKIDEAQIIQQGINLAITMATYESYVRFKDTTTELAVGKKKPGVTVARTAADYDLLTQLKFEADCSHTGCTGTVVQMIRALQGEEGVSRDQDYRGNTAVVGAYAYVDNLDIGLVVKVDASEADEKSVVVAAQLAGCSVVAIIISMAILTILTTRLLRAMDVAWVEGRLAVEREKQQFADVIQAMYPAQVSKRILAGEPNIVYNVSSACVFFSDIYEFTTTSNAATPEELIQFLGYVFGTMDQAAEHFHIYKVKTIGDAYLGVAGLPGYEPLNGSFVMDMLLFASACCQMFSNRYDHPQEGEAMAIVERTLFQRKKNVRMAVTQDGTEPQLQTEEKAEEASTSVHCVMRYGLAVGPITSGVLNGKTPMFDIWGKTVNLASRMESTGIPGRIQVSEGVYQTVIAQKGQPFTFDVRHKVYCKGFGSVTAYFVARCDRAPPKELLERLRITPNLGQYYFENAVPGLKMGAAGAYELTASGGGSLHESAAVDRHSVHSVDRQSARSASDASANGPRGSDYA